MFVYQENCLKFNTSKANEMGLLDASLGYLSGKK